MQSDGAVAEFATTHVETFAAGLAGGLVDAVELLDAAEVFADFGFDMALPEIGSEARVSSALRLTAMS